MPMKKFGKKDMCFFCKKKGYIKKNCQKYKKNGKKRKVDLSLMYVMNLISLISLIILGGLIPVLQLTLLISSMFSQPKEAKGKYARYLFKK